MWYAADIQLASAISCLHGRQIAFGTKIIRSTLHTIPYHPSPGRWCWIHVALRHSALHIHHLDTSCIAMPVPVVPVAQSTQIWQGKKMQKGSENSTNYGHTGGRSVLRLWFTWTQNIFCIPGKFEIKPSYPCSFWSLPKLAIPAPSRRPRPSINDLRLC